jgi:hypothetical protein
MNAVLAEEERLDEPALKSIFDALWPQLKKQLDELPGIEEPEPRSERELIEEILEIVRTDGFIFNNSTLSASGPGSGWLTESFFGGRRVIPSDISQRYWITSESDVPQKILERLDSIAGPNGQVMMDSESVVLLSPRVGADDFTTEEQVFLDTTREFLEARGRKLVYMDFKPSPEG